MNRRRLDVEMVRRGISRSREQARVAIAEGRVLVSGSMADKPARLVAPDDPVRMLEPAAAHVSRGGDKLAAALDEFGIDPAGKRALDAGASTGGFTDCLLQRGAESVVAVDVGHGQLDERLRHDKRVDVRERCNVRYLDADELGGTVSIVVADLSFISLRTVMASLVGLLDRDGVLVALVKPQFEVGRAEVSRGRGIVRDPELWFESLAGVGEAAAAVAMSVTAAMVSPLTGAKGNVEFLVRIESSNQGREVDAATLRTISLDAARED